MGIWGSQRIECTLGFSPRDEREDSPPSLNFAGKRMDLNWGKRHYAVKKKNIRGTGTLIYQKSGVGGIPS